MDGHRGFGRDAAALADSVYRRCASALREPPSLTQPSKITELEHLFEQSPTQQLAYHTILSQVQRHPLSWKKNSGAAVADMPVPPWWDQFVADIVRQMLITGVAFYKVMVRRGLDMGVVAPIGSVHPRWNTRKSAFEPDRSGWRMLVLESPLRLTNSRTMLRSGAVRAEKATHRLLELQDNWHNRDRMNSKPAVFTTISSELANQNGSQRQWFKNVTNPDILQTRAVDVDSSFSTLVHKRAETIRELDAITSLRRGQRAIAGKAPTPGTHAAVSSANDGDEGDHYEHIVSDGRAYTEARPLHSLPDTKIMMDDLAHSIFFAFGVPPQALGKNINSERLASSNRLTEMAITSFDLMVHRTRTIIGSAIEAATEQDSGLRIGFCTVLTSHELNELMPMLKTNTAIDMLARHSGLPRSAFDPERVQGVQCSANTGADKPTPQGKRPRTEEETVAVLRKRAREPSA